MKPVSSLTSLFFPHLLPYPSQKCISKCPSLGVQCGKKKAYGTAIPFPKVLLSPSR